MYIGIDLGSTNIKAAIYDKDFRLIDRQSRPVSYIRENGFVEFDAFVYCQELIGLLQQMVRENGVTHIRELAFTGQAESLVVLGADGKPLMNAISWMDERSNAECEELSKQFDVSRQVIVEDISALRKEGKKIVATHYGYVAMPSLMKTRDFKVRHTTEQTESELSIIVGLGGTVDNVYVWHKVYGKIEASLGISALHHIKQFIEGVRSGKSTELMNITGGYHYHTVRAESEKMLDEIEFALKEKGYIVPEI